MSESERFEILVLGSGAGGKLLAWHMAQSGRRTAVVERRWIGGSCPNVNCMPSKNEIHSAKVASLVRHGAEYGARTGPVEIDMGTVRELKRHMVDRQIAAHLHNYEASGTELIMGSGRFVAPRTLEVQLNDGGTRLLVGDRVFINVRFADPNTYSEQDRQHNYLQSSYPPFTYAVTTDPLSGIRDGILHRPRTDPLVMQVDSQSEFWQLHGSLNVVDGVGNPVAIPDNVRLYFVGNTAHAFISGSFLFPTPGTAPLCSNPTPGSGLNWETLRATLRNLDRWAVGNGQDNGEGNGQGNSQGTEPPKSNYPSLLDGTLVTRNAAAAAFPAIPNVIFPRCTTLTSC